MNKDLLYIIDNARDVVYDLNAYINGVKSEKIKDNLWNDLRVISLEGSSKQRFVALTVISINKPSYLEDLSCELIEHFNYMRDEFILKPTVNICSIIGKPEHLKFMINALDYIKNKKNEYLYEVILNNIIATKYWEIIINEIVEYTSRANTLAFIDLFAFFMYKHNKNEYNKLVSHFTKENQEKVAMLHHEILERLRNGYQRLE